MYLEVYAFPFHGFPTSTFCFSGMEIRRLLSIVQGDQLLHGNVYQSMVENLHSLLSDYLFH